MEFEGLEFYGFEAEHFLHWYFDIACIDSTTFDNMNQLFDILIDMDISDHDQKVVID